MKIEFTLDWCMQMARIEGTSSIVAGAHAKILSPHPQIIGPAASDPAAAFGKLIKLLRRDRKLSPDDLAKKANVELSDLIQIESNSDHKPEPRTIHQLATFFGIPKNKLYQLSGLTAANDTHLVEEAIRFAASADPGTELSKAEREALRAFLAILKERS